MAKFTIEVTTDKITYTCEAFGRTYGYSMIRQREGKFRRYTGQWKGDKPGFEKQVKLADEGEFLEALDETESGDVYKIADFFDLVGGDVDWPIGDDGWPLAALPDGYVFPDHSEQATEDLVAEEKKKAAKKKAKKKKRKAKKR